VLGYHCLGGQNQTVRRIIWCCRQ